MKLFKIINARKSIESFADMQDIEFHLAYWMSKFMAKTESENNFYVAEASKLFREYAMKDDAGNFVIPAESVSQFNAAIEKINDIDVEDPGIRFNLSELSSELKLSMKQIYPLLDFIDEDK